MKLNFYINMEIATFTWGGQLYLIPAISYTYDKMLHGRYSIDISWLKWGVSIYFGQER
jgi:hypothetical protein